MGDWNLKNIFFSDNNDFQTVFYVTDHKFEITFSKFKTADPI